MQSLAIEDIVQILDSFPLGGAEGVTIVFVTLFSLGVVLVVSNCLYRQRVIKAINSTYPATFGLPTVDVARCGGLIRQYNRHCVYNMLTSLAVIYAVCFHIQGSKDYNNVPGLSVLQALAVVSITNAMAGLYLSIFFSNVLLDVMRSNEGVLGLARAAESINLALLLAMPFSWTCSAIMSFVLYRLAAGVAWIFASHEPSSNDELHVATILALYISLVLFHSAFAKRIFIRLKT